MSIHPPSLGAWAGKLPKIDLKSATPARLPTSEQVLAEARLFERMAALVNQALPWAKVEINFEVSTFNHIVTIRPHAFAVTKFALPVRESKENDNSEKIIKAMLPEVRAAVLKVVEANPAVQELIRERGYISRARVARIAGLLDGEAALLLLELVHDLKE